MAMPEGTPSPNVVLRVCVCVLAQTYWEGRSAAEALAVYPATPSGGQGRGSLLSDWLTRTSTESEKLHMPEREKERERAGKEGRTCSERGRDADFTRGLPRPDVGGSFLLRGIFR